MNETKSMLEQIINRALSETEPARLEHFILGLISCIVCIFAPKVWPTMRNVVTLVHEYGHAAVGILTGRRLAGIALHKDTSGATTSYGTRGLGGILSLIPTLIAGYTFPGFVGIALLYSGSQGQPRLVLSICFILIAFMVPFIRSIHAIFVIFSSLAVLAILIYYAPATITQGFVTTTGMFLVIGGFVAILELGNHHRKGQGEGSDAHQLALGIEPLAKVWIAIFTIYGAATLVIASIVIWQQL